MSVEHRVIKILAAQALLEPSDVSLDNSPDDLGIDSLGLVETIFAIEEEFDISVPFNINAPTETAFDISTVAKIVQGVETIIEENSK